ncbi:MAG TPA: haloacid dehalogenase type II [Hyphomonadaceae bacterium]|nr:haloacid dehalogenase type II [Hyphomonadaceae bacterium]
MADLSDIRVLAFDVFGTTVDWNAGIAREAKALLAPKGHKLDWVAFANDYRKQYQPAMEAVRSGKRGYVWMDMLHREMLDPVLAEYGVSDVSDAERMHLALGWRRLDPWPDVVEGMLRLKKKFVLAACSNANIALATEMAKRGGLPWDVILGAELVKMYKPRPEVYDSVGQVFGIKPAQVMMVACHDWDLKGAMARGLRSAYVRRADEYGKGNALPEPKPGTHDVHCNSFIELASALGA